MLFTNWCFNCFKRIYKMLSLFMAIPKQFVHSYRELYFLILTLPICAGGKLKFSNLDCMLSISLTFVWRKSPHTYTNYVFCVLKAWLRLEVVDFLTSRILNIPLFGCFTRHLPFIFHTKHSCIAMKIYFYYDSRFFSLLFLLAFIHWNKLTKPAWDMDYDLFFQMHRNI